MSLRTKLNKLLMPRGYKLIKYDPFKEQLMEECLKNGGFSFIQIGANDGVRFDDLYDFVTYRKCRGVVIEPVSIYFQQLQKNYAAYPLITPLNCAVHSSKKKERIYYVDPEAARELRGWAQGIGSFDPEHHHKSNIDSQKMVSEEVDCMHLMEIVEGHNMQSVSYLQIDTEGYDFEVLKMIDFDVIQPRLIKYEHAYLKEQDQAAANQLLQSQGYQVVTQIENTYGVKH